MSEVNKTKPNHSAFNSALQPRDSEEAKQNGLTKREYFAAMAMQGLLHNFPPFADHQGNKDLISQGAVKYADALIIELNKDTKE